MEIQEIQEVEEEESEVEKTEETEKTEGLEATEVALIRGKGTVIIVEEGKKLRTIQESPSSSINKVDSRTIRLANQAKNDFKSQLKEKSTLKQSSNDSFSEHSSLSNSHYLNVNKNKLSLINNIPPKNVLGLVIPNSFRKTNSNASQDSHSFGK